MSCSRRSRRRACDVIQAPEVVVEALERFSAVAEAAPHLVGVAQEEINELEKSAAKSDVETVVTEKKQGRSIPAEPATVIEVENRAAQPQQKAGDPWSTVLDGANEQAGKEARPAADLPMESSFSVRLIGTLFSE